FAVFAHESAKSLCYCHSPVRPAMCCGLEIHRHETEEWRLYMANIWCRGFRAVPWRISGSAAAFSGCVTALLGGATASMGGAPGHRTAKGCVVRPPLRRTLSSAAKTTIFPRNLAFAVQGAASLGVRRPASLGVRRPRSSTTERSRSAPGLRQPRQTSAGPVTQQRPSALTQRPPEFLGASAGRLGRGDDDGPHPVIVQLTHTVDGRSGG